MNIYVKTFESFVVNEAAPVIRVNRDDDNYREIVAKNCPVYVVTKNDVDSTYNYRKKSVQEMLKSNKEKIRKMSGSYMSKFSDVIERIEQEIETTVLEMSTKWLMANNGLSGKFYEAPYQKKMIDFIYKEITGVIDGNWLYRQALNAMIDGDNVDEATKQVNGLFDRLQSLYNRTRAQCTRGAQNMIDDLAPECPSVLDSKGGRPVRCPVKQRPDLIVLADVENELDAYKKKIVDKLKSYV